MRLVSLFLVLAAAAVVACSTTSVSAAAASTQELGECELRVGKKAPRFAPAKAYFPNGTISTLTLEQVQAEGKWTILFFFPLAFTFVCPSELLELSAHFNDFENIQTLPIAISVDSIYSLQSWTRVPIREGGISNVKMPLMSDIKKDISQRYQVLIEEEGIALRGSFLIDPEGILRYSQVNDLPVGRNIDELLRLTRAFQFTAKSGGEKVCPSKWKGEDSATIIPDPVGKHSFFEKLEEEMKSN